MTNRTNLLSSRCFIILFAIFCVTPTISFAQQIEEVVVTAQKRSESIQDVPIAISAFNGDDIRNIGAENLQDLTENVAGAELYDSRGAGQPVWVIRGVGLSDFNANNTPAAAIYYDEFYLTSNVMGGIGLFDIEQVEVLKGPQGGLYGRNTTGGAVRVQSKRPSFEEHSGYVSASYGRWDRATIEGGVGGPLSDTVAYRISGKTDLGGGWQDSLATAGDDNHGDREFYSVKGQLLFAPTDDLEILLKAETGVDKSENRLALAIGSHDPNIPFLFCPAALAGGRDNSSCITSAGANRLALGLPPVGGVDPSVQSSDGRRTLSSPINEVDNEWKNFNIQVDWDLGFATLTSVSGYIDYDQVQVHDFDATAALSLDEFSDVEMTAWSQEFRLTSNSDGNLNWIIAAMYSEDEIDDARFTRHLDNPFVFWDRADRAYRQEAESFAIYGVVGYQLNDNLNINGSLRYTEEDRSYQDGFLSFDTLPPGVPPFVPLPFFLTQNLNTELELEDHWSGHIGLDWTPTNDALIYAKITRGFKSGGVFGGFPVDPDTVNAADEETVWAYEIGFKSEWLDNSLRLNGAVYHYDYSDVQGYATAISTITNTPLSQYGNIGDAEHTGVELEVLWLPIAINGLSLSGSFSWLDAEISNSSRTTTTIQGAPFPIEGLDRLYAPEISYSFQAKYEWPVFDGMLAAAQINYSYRDDIIPQSALPGNIDSGLAEVDGYDLLNARIALESVEGDWVVALSGRNLAGEEYSTYADEDGFFNYAEVPGTPRTWSIEFTYNW